MAMFFLRSYTLPIVFFLNYYRSISLRSVTKKSEEHLAKTRDAYPEIQSNHAARVVAVVTREKEKKWSSSSENAPENEYPREDSLYTLSQARGEKIGLTRGGQPAHYS